MATVRQNFQTALEAASAKLAQLQLDRLDLPEVNGPVAVKYDSYEARLLKRIEWLQVQIAQCEGGFEIYAEADT